VPRAAVQPTGNQAALKHEALMLQCSLLVIGLHCSNSASCCSAVYWSLGCSTAYWSLGCTAALLYLLPAQFVFRDVYRQDGQISDHYTDRALHTTCAASITQITSLSFSCFPFAESSSNFRIYTLHTAVKNISKFTALKLNVIHTLFTW